MKLLTIYFMVFLCLSCVKKRPVEEYQDFDGNRWNKATFLTKKPWLYRVTLVNNGLNSTFGFVGMQSEARLGFFEFTQDELRFLAPKTDFTDGPNTEGVINSWSIQHTEIYRKEVNGRKSNVESENNEIPWFEKSQFKVNWESAVVRERASFPFSLDESCWQVVNRKPVEGSQEVSPEHIAFTVAVDYLIDENCIGYREYYNQDFTITIHYKYSFMPDPGTEGYDPYVYTGENDPLMDKYGYFNTSFLGYDSQRRPQNKFFMNRWHPEKTHTFYFTKDFPEEHKWIYTDSEVGVFPRTNKVFADAGLKIRFEIADAPEDVKFGDVRYSFIHFVDQPDLSAPLGYGPSTAHPYSGEIISANSVIWTNDLKFYVQRVKEYQERQENRATVSPVYRKMTEILGEEPASWSQSSAFLGSNGEAFRYSLPEFTYELPGTGFAGREVEFSFDTLDRAIQLGGMDNFDQSFQARLNSSREILTDLDEFKKTREYFDNPRLSTRYDLDEKIFAGLIQTPIEDEKKVIDDILYRVAIHEFGHNLNLRHNFYGSVGAGIDQAQNLAQPRASNSVMDYLTLQDELNQPYDWEPYDRAALVYSYSSGQVDPAKDRPAPYLFCTDHHTLFNPLCNRFDRGATPTQIVESMIESYDDNYWLRNFRYGRAYWQTGSYGRRIFSTMYDLKKMVRFYDQAWQPNTLDQVLGNFGLEAEERTTLGNSMRADALQAVKMVASFYGSIIAQASSDRPFSDSYDPATGALTQIGITDDKIYAALFLMGEDAFPLDPNRGTTVFSLASLAENDTQLQGFVRQALKDAFVDGGDMYSGYDGLIRRMFALTAAGRFELTGETAEMDRMQVRCYTLANFNSRFSPANPLGEGVNQIPVPAAVTEYAGEANVAALRIADTVFTAGANGNDLAFEVVNGGDKIGARELHRLYERLVYDRLTATCESGS
ncbi:zinc-dependent metalloprotease [Pseudobacteriovorax antillogorgiicola]|uniref:EcxA zinc-binding domain-containing protein n=1 Tax=Pseudobacteriovorax antillogorgiicola TaxID=1513793 RepID=A0A1Y6C2M2_9BACT|nr:zinc-dependent metalloprotease [Pseudobacteriovorax antillogorgiicola]TCS49764.1 uncharacterized protein DUF4953 [Pseudobacteriovorax antillogorgiicola]SMF42606.1 protein of unknown function [Pseudobacteriovorax antillogorgiicola]